MIPRRPTPAPKPAAPERPDDAPPVEHRAVDYDFGLLNGALLPVTISDDNGRLDEQPDRYVYKQGDETLTILKSALAYVRRVDRTFYTEAKLFTPDDANLAPVPVVASEPS